MIFLDNNNKYNLFKNCGKAVVANMSKTKCGEIMNYDHWIFVPFSGSSADSSMTRNDI